MADRRTALRWWVGRRRRPVAAALAGLAVWAGLAALHPPAARLVPVLAASRDLPAGARLGPADVGTVGLPGSAVPAGALRPGATTAGRALAGAVRKGEPLTDVRLSSTLLLPAGTVEAPLRLADPGEATLVHVGDRVDVLATMADATTVADQPTGTAPVVPAREAQVAAGVVVLAVPQSTDEGSSLGAGGADGGGLIIVAATRQQAAALARAASGARVSITVRGG